MEAELSDDGEDGLAGMEDEDLDGTDGELVRRGRGTKWGQGREKGGVGRGEREKDALIKCLRAHMITRLGRA